MTILLILIASSLGAIAFFSSKETSYLLLDASVLAASPQEYSDENLRVRGFVKLGSLLREGKTAKFVLEHEGKEIPVFFNGETLLPDAFKEGAPARVDGKWEKGTLLATHVEAKCASKYEANYSNDKTGAGNATKVSSEPNSKKLNY